ncbi:MAG: type I phosphomannose isomerase catalytic subunit [Halobacteriota archaeon]|nr:type I phosphomannose isomerase catalytic subunit [Halobacteriota archaeon]
MTGFDVIIIVSSTQEQANFWYDRLRSSELIGDQTKIYSIFEDWEGGAGQLLGTLNAWNEVSKKANLDTIIKNGGSIAIYHTAGKGTRIAPLGLTEIDKGAVRLPRLVDYSGNREAITLLEAVIDQTSIFSETRKRRICVFWGDGLFVPSKDVGFEGDYHVELFGIREEAPEEKKDWDAKWKSYGLIIPGDEGSIQREKQSWEDYNRLLEKGLIKRSEDGNIILGKSMGCFSVSYTFFKELLSEYEKELSEKIQKLDTDPHLWMPLTSFREDFEDKELWDRVNKFKDKIPNIDFLFADKDLGKDTYWWDFGQLQLYHSNLLKLLEDSDEGDVMRGLFEVGGNFLRDAKSEDLEVKDSIILNSEIEGRVERCIIVNSKSRSLDAEDSVFIDSQINRALANRGVIYNCIEPGDLRLNEETVTDLFHPKKGRIRMRTRQGRDGKKDWDHRITPNYYTYAEAGSLMKDQESGDIEAERLRWEYYFELGLGEEFGSLKNGFIKPMPNLVEKSWGGSRIEELKGIDPCGKRIGESWECSTHPNNPSMLLKMKGIKVPLIHLLNYASEDILGEGVASEFRGELPILLKFLDAGEDLSLQVHPSDEWAEKLGEADSGKNEAWFILDCEPGSKLYIGFKEGVEDPGSIGVDKLNCTKVRPGDVFNIPAGTIHAIGNGILLLEIQQSSDLTYRVWDWDREPRRQLHIEKAKKALSFEPSKIEDFKQTPEQISPNETILIATPYFTLSSLKLEEGTSVEEQTGGAFKILICTCGEVKLNSEENQDSLRKGESFLVPASIASYQITALEGAKVLKACPSKK